MAMKKTLPFNPLLTLPLTLLPTLLLVAAFPGLCLAQSDAAAAGARDIHHVSSLGESLHDATRGPLHILYVHGIGAQGLGDSKKFQQGICRLIPSCKISKDPNKIIPFSRDYADSGEYEIDGEAPQIKY